MTPTPHGDARFWDKTARRYAAGAISDLPGYERTLDRTRALLIGAGTVLEIGGGTGTTALRLAPGVGRLISTDASGGMIAIAREKAMAQGCTNVEFIQAPAANPPDVDGAYDAVLAFSLLHLLADLPAALARVHRLLRPGGLFISKTPCLSEMNRLIRLAVPIARVFGQAPHVALFTAAELEADMVAAGFSIVEQARHGSGRRDPRIFLVARRP